MRKFITRAHPLPSLRQPARRGRRAGDSAPPACRAGWRSTPRWPASITCAPLDRLVLQLKFGGKLALAPLLAQLLRDAVLEHRSSVLPDVLCPVRWGRSGWPNAASTRRSKWRGRWRRRSAFRCVRGWRSARSIRRAIGRGADQRRRNMQQRVHRRAGCAGAGARPHIGIVDDVMTSGHTLDELAATFKRSARRASATSCSRVPRPIKSLRRSIVSRRTVEPEIPPNTGNVIRLCANTGAQLHLIEPLGFPLDDAKMKRAGLDYHDYATMKVHRTGTPSSPPPSPIRRACSPDHARLVAVRRRQLPARRRVRVRLRDARPGARAARSFPPAQRIRLPMRPDNRSLNLSNTVAVVVFEAWRQNGYAGGA